MGLAYLPASETAVVRTLEGQLLDLRLRLRPAAPADPALLLVLIDDPSIRRIGRWPWSRTVLADLVARLRAAGAATIGFDLLFAEPEPVADQALAEEIRAAGNVVLPFSFDFAPGSGETRSPPAALAASAFRIVQGRMPVPLPLVATGVLPPVPALADAAAGLGHSNVALDRDGSARFDYPVIAYQQEYFPSFALEVARQHRDVARERVRVELGHGIRLGDRLIPTDEAMRIVVNYRGSDRFERVSAAEVLAGEVAAPRLAGKIVLIGGSAVGVGERFASPFDPLLPGIARHATVIDSILRQDHVVRRDAAVLADLAVVVLGGLAIGWLGRRRSLLALSLGAGVLITGLIAANVLALARFGLWLNLLLPVLALGAIYASLVLYSYLAGARQERRLRAAFKHYLSPELVDQVARDPSLLRLGGEPKELTVLFADLRDSTRLATALPPAVFVELLNEVMEAITRVLFAHGGMLDKFTGDGLVAVFGAPLPQPDHPLRACRAALAMQTEVETLRARWARPDLPALEIGIGINTGTMIIGNMGSRARFSYTVIGDEAHLGARLEAANKEFRTRILISEATWQRVRDAIAARELDEVRFRGFARPVRVFEVVGPKPLPARDAELCERFTAALAAYRDGQRARAATLFEEVLAIAPDDHPSRLYLERCRAWTGDRPS